MTDDHFEENCSADEISKDIVHALNDLPILARLEFVKNIIFDRGGSRDVAPRDEMLVIATEVLRDVINVLRDHPTAAQLHKPNL